MKNSFLFLLMCFVYNVYGQNTPNVSGTVRNALTNEVIKDAEIWNNDQFQVRILSTSNGKFEMTTNGTRILLICERTGFLPFNQYITLPWINEDILLTPNTEPVIKLTLVFNDKKTNQRLSKLKLQFDNLNGFDKEVNEKEELQIPKKMIINNNSKIRFQVEKEGYPIQKYEIIFNDDEKNKGLKDEIIYLARIENKVPKSWVLIPSAYQFKTGQKVKGSLILGGQVLSVASIFISQTMANQAYNDALLNKNNTSQYLSYLESERNWQSAQNWSIGIALGIYAYNLIDGLVYKEPEKLASRNWRVYPMTSYAFNGVSFIYKF